MGDSKVVRLWTQLLRRDERKRVFPDLANVLIALRGAMPDIAALDEMRQITLLMLEPPIAPGGSPSMPDQPRPISDDDVGRIQEFLHTAGLPRVGREMVGQAVYMIGVDNRFHPVRDWLNTLVWDGEQRLGGWLQTYLGAEGETDYLAAIGRMFLIAMAARILKPGCKADYMLVLEGEQGVEKSKACAALAGEYFSDNLPQIHSKDASLHMRGKWLVEIAELAAIAKADAEGLKAFLTRTHERYRPPYGRADVNEPRVGLLIGTTNKHVYVRDDTGARRYWPLRVGKIDVEALTRDRDQLFAEAVDRFRHGEHWWPDSDFERQWIRPEQEIRIEGEPWDEAARKYLNGDLMHKPAGENTFPEFYPRKDRVTVTQIAREALGFETVSRIGTADQRRIIAILQDMGWERKKSEGVVFYWRPLRERDGPTRL